ncbi:MAG: RDD family protein [Actinomycetota bacterium]|nr:RDD family protein [Actinomycetota bacterium]
MTQPIDPQPAAPAGMGPSGPRANFGQRLVAVIIDTVLIVIVAGIAFAINEVLGYIVYLVLGLGYYGYFEGTSSGQTVGKKVMGIRVVDFNTGGPIGYGRGFLRWLGKLVAGIPCYLGYLWMLWDREKQAWQDKIATTVVVPESAYPVEKWPG